MSVTVVNSQIPNLRDNAVLRVEKSRKDMDRAPKRIVIGLLNNMSVGALDATERQFVALLESASDGLSIQLKRFALPEILEGESASVYRDRNYESSDLLEGAEIDGLIVTGREPTTPDLRNEQYWPSFVRVLEWAQSGTISTVWSCLAAHAAVLHLDGIQRVRSERKHSGIYPCTRVSDHPIAAGVPLQFRCPHSRWNGLREADIMRAGYEVITQTEGGEVDCFLREGRSLFVFFQGHAEYQAETLLLEFRRDVGRFLRGEAANYPAIPQGYFDRATTAELRRVELHAIERQQEDTLAQIASIISSVDKQNGWLFAASRIYRNWLEYIHTEKTSRADARQNAEARESGSGGYALQSMHG
jgi:homoserine O-succinyltransferase/O-acetyltransferase